MPYTLLLQPELKQLARQQPLETLITPTVCRFHTSIFSVLPREIPRQLSLYGMMNGELKNYMNMSAVSQVVSKQPNQRRALQLTLKYICIECNVNCMAKQTTQNISEIISEESFLSTVRIEFRIKGQNISESSFVFSVTCVYIQM